MFLSEIHPRVRKELHRREFILKRMPAETEKIRQTTTLDPKNENRDLLAESFAKSPWVRVFSPIDSTKLIDDAWRNKLNNIRKKNPFFGQSNHYFEPNGDLEKIEKWKDFEADMHIDNPLGGYDTVLLQSGLMGRKNINDPEKFGAKDPNENKMFVGFKEVYGRGRPTGDPLASKSELKQRYVGGALPIPGVKNVTIAYKGGVKAIKEATIDWVCWSPEDLELLTPHFLEMGKLVTLEWGWGGLGGTNSPIPLDFNRILNSATTRKDIPNLHDDIQETVFENGGNYDAMVGVISNFEWSLRSDGGFDCTTTLVSRGVGVLNAVIGGSAVGSPPLTLDDRIEQELGIDVKLSKEAGWEWDHEGTLTSIPGAVGEDFLSMFGVTANVFDEGLIKYEEDDNTPYIGSIVDDLTGGFAGEHFEFVRSQGITVPPGLTFSNFIRQMKKQVMAVGEQMEITSKKIKEYIENEDYTETAWENVIKGEMEGKKISEGVIYPASWGFLNNVEVGPWISWGWIEDNVLSRFLGKVDIHGTLIQEFRSVDAIRKGEDLLGWEPTKISNHKQLITADPKICIIPGQYPLSESTVNRGFFSKLIGRGQTALNAAMVFTSKLTDEGITPITPAPFRAYQWSGTTHPSQTETVTQYHIVAKECDPIHEAGYMRNLLIHIDAFEEAFGGADSVEAGCMALFNKLNSTSGIWDLQLSTEGGDGVKVVDRNYTDNKMWELLNEEKCISKCKNPLNDNSKVTGKLFVFPTWNRDSMTKSCNLTAKFPDSTGVTAMYGGLAVPGAEAPMGGGNPSDFLAATTIFSTPDRLQNGITSVWKNEGGKSGKFGTQFPYNLSVDKDKWKHFGMNYGFDFDLSQKDNEDPKAFVNEVINTESFLRTELTWNLKEIIARSKGKGEGPLSDIKPYEESLEAYQEAEKKELIPDPQKKDMSNKDPYDVIYNYEGKLKNKSPNKYLDTMKYIIGISKSTSVFAIGGSSPLLDMELDIELQGIGGITPGNVFSISNLPRQYLDGVLFQATEINHEISDTGWNTTLKGQMRVNISHEIELSKTPVPKIDKIWAAAEIKDFEDISHHPLSGGDQEKQSIKNANRARNPDGSIGRPVRTGTYDTGTQVLEG